MSSSYEESPCVLAGTLARLYTQALQARLLPHRASAAQYPVLERLWLRDGQTQSELCRSLNVEQPTLANTLNRMVRDQLVRKVKDNNDRRQIIIRLTKRGRELRDVLSGSVAEVGDAAIVGLDASQLQIFQDVTRQIIANLRSDLEQPPIMLDDSLVLDGSGSPDTQSPGTPDTASAPDSPAGLAAAGNAAVQAAQTLGKVSKTPVSEPAPAPSSSAPSNAENSISDPALEASSAPTTPDQEAPAVKSDAPPWASDPTALENDTPDPENASHQGVAEDVKDEGVKDEDDVLVLDDQFALKD